MRAADNQRLAPSCRSCVRKRVTAVLVVAAMLTVYTGARRYIEIDTFIQTARHADRVRRLDDVTQAPSDVTCWSSCTGPQGHCRTNARETFPGWCNCADGWTGPNATIVAGQVVALDCTEQCTVNDTSLNGNCTSDSSSAAPSALGSHSTSPTSQHSISSTSTGASPQWTPTTSSIPDISNSSSNQANNQERTTNPPTTSNDSSVVIAITTAGCREKDCPIGTSDEAGTGATSTPLIVVYTLCGVIVIAVVVLVALCKRQHRERKAQNRSATMLTTITATHTKLSSTLPPNQTIGKGNPIFIDDEADRSPSVVDLIQPDGGSDTDLTSTTTEVTAVSTNPLISGRTASGSQQPPPLPGERADSPQVHRRVWRRSNTVGGEKPGGLLRNWRQQTTPPKEIPGGPPPLPGEDGRLSASPPPLPGESNLRRQAMSALALRPQVFAAALPRGAPPAPPPIPLGGFPPQKETDNLDSQSASSLETIISGAKNDGAGTPSNEAESKDIQANPELTQAAEKFVAEAVAAVGGGSGVGTSSNTGVYEIVRTERRVSDDLYLSPTDNLATGYAHVGSKVRSSDGYATIGSKKQAPVADSNGRRDGKSSSLRRQALNRSSARLSRKTPSMNKPVGPPMLPRVSGAASQGMPSSTVTQESLPSPKEEEGESFELFPPFHTPSPTVPGGVGANINLTAATLNASSSCEMVHSTTLSSPAMSSTTMLVDSGVAGDALDQVEQSSSQASRGAASSESHTTLSSGSSSAVMMTLKRHRSRGEHLQTLPSMKRQPQLTAGQANDADEHYWAARKARDAHTLKIDRYAAMAQRSYFEGDYNRVARARSASPRLHTASYF